VHRLAGLWKGQKNFTAESAESPEKKSQFLNLKSATNNHARYLNKLFSGFVFKRIYLCDLCDLCALCGESVLAADRRVSFYPQQPKERLRSSSFR